MESHDETPLIGENDMIIISSREQVAKKQTIVIAEKGMILVSIKESRILNPIHQESW